MKRLIDWTQVNGIDFISYCITFALVRFSYNAFKLDGQYTKFMVVHDLEVLVAAAFISFFAVYSIDSIIEFTSAVQTVNTLKTKLTANKITRNVIKFGRYILIAVIFEYLDVPDTTGAGLLMFGIFFFLFGFVAYSQYSKELNSHNNA